MTVQVVSLHVLLKMMLWSGLIETEYSRYCLLCQTSYLTGDDDTYDTRDFGMYMQAVLNYSFAHLLIRVFESSSLRVYQSLSSSSLQLLLISEREHPATRQDIIFCVRKRLPAESLSFSCVPVFLCLSDTAALRTSSMLVDLHRADYHDVDVAAT